MKTAVKRFLSKHGINSLEAIVELQEEEIASLCEETCFDAKDIMRPLKLRNKKQQLLNSHLAMEHVLTRLIEQQLEHDRVINLDRWSFMQKLDLAFALGLFENEIYILAKEINRLRNKMAHEFGFQLDVSHLQKLREKAPEHLLKQPEGNRFSDILGVTIFWLEGARQRDLFQQIMAIRAKENVKTALARFQALNSKRLQNDTEE
ncbi:MAG: hypothetical protein GYB25_11530 [Rhodobacteraceae bacterium]|nr:hypothetical protein [Paracoccaceae bacterium]